jgi:hypothetical protein
MTAEDLHAVRLSFLTPYSTVLTFIVTSYLGPGFVVKATVKVKQSNYRPGEVLWVPES